MKLLSMLPLLGVFLLAVAQADGQDKLPSETTAWRNMVVALAALALSAKLSRLADAADPAHG